MDGVVRFQQILLIFLVFGLSDTVKAQVMVTNLSESVVQAAVNSAVAGEEVQLPAGTAIWTTALVITNNISLVGAGSGNTIIVDDIPNANYSYLIEWSTVSNYTQCELSGFSLEDSSSDSGRGNWIAEIHFYGFCPVCHVTGCMFQNLLDPAVEFDQGTCGCIDHCQFPDTNFANQILCYNGALGGFTPADGENPYGDLSYAMPVTYGTTNNWIYIESCSFWYPTYSNPLDDARAGSRVVFRYNMVTNEYFQDHGTETSGRIRSARAFEVYDNFFLNNAVGYTNQGNAIGFRGGTGVLFSNICVGYSSVMELVDFRATGGFPSWGGGDGYSPWDTNGGVVASGTFTGPTGQTWLTDANASWAANQWVGGYPGSGNTNWAYICVDATQAGTNPYYAGSAVNFGIIASNGVHDCYLTASHLGYNISWANGDTYQIVRCYAQLDQPGRGQGDLLGDNAPSSSQPYDTVTGKTNWPNQALEPWYQWNNTNNGYSANFVPEVGYYGNEDSIYPIIINGRDYYDNTAKPGYTPLPFPHPLDTTNSLSTSPTFTLTVIDGTGSSHYTNGAVVSISADPAATTTNAAFAYWTGSDIANTNQPNTTITMPAANLTVTANYVPLPPSMNKPVSAP